MKPAWYVLRSKPQKELFVHDQLRARGFEVFYPYLKIKPVNPRSRTTKPYFPGYLFVHADLAAEGFSAFQWVPGTVGLVSLSGVPTSVPDELVNAIRTHLEILNNGVGPQEEKFHSGDVVFIQGGIFDGSKAIFDAHIQGRERARVLLEFLKGRQTALVLPASQIRPSN